MYVPAHFAMSDQECLDVLSGMGAGDLVTTGPDGLTATYLPFQLERVETRAVEHDGRLRGLQLHAHLARNNDQWRHAGEALVIVHAQDHYVSPAWLPSRDAGRVVPTWDYVTVHAYGEIVAQDDPAWLARHVRALTDRHEQGLWSVDDADPQYVERMLRAIVGVQVRLTRVTGKAKMSQNRPPADVEALADAIEGHDPHGAHYLRTVSLPAARQRASVLEEVARHRPTVGKG